MPVKIQVVFYSMYGHIWRMAEAIADGARELAGVEVRIFRVPETIPADILEKHGAAAAQKSFNHIPVIQPAQLLEADAIVFGTPTRFGNMAAQMRNFLDQTGQIWATGGLIGKVGSVFVSSASQHGGQETTITSFHTTLLHHGMVIVGVPYSEQKLLVMDQISGGSPYGATTLAGARGERNPSENELAIARFQGRHVAQITSKLAVK